MHIAMISSLMYTVMVDSVNFAMLLTRVFLTDKVMKTEWDVIGGGGPAPKVLEDVIHENRWLQRIEMSGRREAAAAMSLPMLGRRLKLEHKTIEPVPHRFYV